ncbi:MAG: hypothetical protein PHI27_01800 [Eubacteriales bacterium]|nr:hypothetical protein [Eubacteriales bacterium]MDD3880966.1 hypothetical protein [Eubacteriales bacterium]MDD4511965.1 hypothetical protein [Eubacteriales bacterium]
MTENAKMSGRGGANRTLKALGLALLVLTCAFGLYIAVIMGEPQENDKTGGDPVKEEKNLASFSELAGRDEFFDQPVLILNEGQGYSFVSGACRRTAKGGMVELNYTSEAGATLTLVSVAPRDDYSLISGDDYTLISDKGAYLAGAKGVLMRNRELRLRIYVATDYCLYICYGAGMSQSDFKLLAQSMQVY